MKTVSDHGTFEEALSGVGETRQAIARALRRLIGEIYPDAVEVPWPNQGIIGYGVGPKKMSEHFCYIGIYKAHINLGFYHGVDLPDPKGLLAGTGKKLRHLKLVDAEEVGRPSVRALVEAALAERQQALGLA